ncbi:MAG: HEAT repeat domain-containing protein [bacterium]
MRKKILIIGSICLVVCLVIGLIIVNFTAVVKKKDGGKVIFVMHDKIDNITLIPLRIANLIIPPPKLANKKPEERKRIVINYLKEMVEAEKRWQLSKRLEISNRILKMGNIVVPTLIEIFRDTSQPFMVRYEADTILEDALRCKNKAPDELEWMYKEFYELAQKIDMESAVPILIEVACNKNEDNRSRGDALSILGKIKDKRAVEPLIRLADEEGIGMRALGEIGDERAIPVLIKVMEADKGKVYPKGITPRRELCIEALGRIGGKQSIEVLMNLFKENPKDRVVINALGDAKAKEAVPMLIDMLEREKNHFVRASIIISLGKIKDKRAVEPLINLARKRFSPPPPEGYDGEVIEALGEIGDERAVEILEELLQREGKGEIMRKYLIKALKKITGKEYKYRR